eukprot:TRINITY_DN6775_c0_g1_i7.p1 TRINITY_DN6775_c0_g1~~TRINITY_DN6775_c0_g1_i7.p1  ORF type:complete len:135 (-),score=10.68 TRINITY_DN6775_c0_g1_i7:97-501(-)
MANSFSFTHRMPGTRGIILPPLALILLLVVLWLPLGGHGMAVQASTSSITTQKKHHFGGCNLDTIYCSWDEFKRVYVPGGLIAVFLCPTASVALLFCASRCFVPKYPAKIRDQQPARVEEMEMTNSQRAWRRWR